VAFNDLLQIFFNRFGKDLKDAEWEKGIKGHQTIIDALRDADLPKATEALRSHLNYHKRSL
jgi:DNA-binding GntR family transcriptional regulator